MYIDDEIKYKMYYLPQNRIGISSTRITTLKRKNCSYGLKELRLPKNIIQMIILL
jgi:hypothetical protein